jgi:hypothetical protein
MSYLFSVPLQSSISKEDTDLDSRKTTQKVESSKAKEPVKKVIESKKAVEYHPAVSNILDLPVCFSI